MDSSAPLTTGPAQVAIATLHTSSGDAGGFVHVVGQPPEAVAGGFRVAGNVVAPPPGETFALALAADLDADGTPDGVAWARASDPLAGRLLFYAGSAGAAHAPRVLAELGATAIGQAGCTAEVGLEQIGQRSLAVSVRAACTPALASGRSSRWIAVASPGSEPALRQELTLAEPEPGERITVELDGSDNDGDQRDDLHVLLAVEGSPAPFQPGPRATAELRWLDRSTGLSRDPSEPEASLSRLASAAASRASKKAEAAEVEASARQIARLYAMICADAGAPILRVSSGAVRCASSRALEEATFAVGRAALTTGDVPRAIAAYERLLWRASSSPSPRQRELEKAITKVAPTRAPSLTRVFATVPDADASGLPAWGPLTFTPTGDLLIRTAAGLSTANVQTGIEGQAQGIPSWPAAVTSGDGATRWLAAFDACDGVALRARFGAASLAPFVVPPGGEAPAGAHELALPIVPPTPSRCAGGAARFEVVPVAWASAGLTAWIAGEPVQVAPDLSTATPLPAVGGVSQPVHAGSPRSPDGGSMALATKLGVLVRARGGWQLWRPADLQGAYAYANLRACTIANDAAAVACVRDGRLIGMLAP